MKQKIKNLLQELLIFIGKNKKEISIFFVFLIIIIVVITVINYQGKKKLEMEKNTDISNTIHAITIQDNVEFYKNAKISMFSKINIIKKGENTYILEEINDKKNQNWYKIKYKDRVGYVLKENLDYFVPSDEEKVLMSDVSKFNVIYNHFENTKDYQLFLLENDINYVYIRAGGRGYGKEGNFYKDPNFQIFIDACEYLKIPYGFYYIDEATNSEEVNEEIEFVINFINENATSMCKLPLAIDIEEHDGKGRADEMWENRVYLAEELIQKFKLRGIDSIIYSNAKTANEYLYNASAYFWVAYYPQENQIPTYWYSDTNQEPTENLEFMNKIVSWQFTEDGVENIVKEKVDLSIVKNDFFSTYVQ